jgi:hypothetical protein
MSIAPQLLSDYEEFFILPNVALLFKRVPSAQTLQELRDLIDVLEETNKEFPIAY